MVKYIWAKEEKINERGGLATLHSMKSRCLWKRFGCADQSKSAEWRGDGCWREGERGRPGTRRYEKDDRVFKKGKSAPGKGRQSVGPSRRGEGGPRVVAEQWVWVERGMRK